MRHLGDTAGVVGDGAVCVNGDRDAGGGQHAHCGQCDAVQTAGFIGQEDAQCDEQDGDPGALHTNGYTTDDGGSGTGLGLLGDLLDEAVVAGSVDLGNFADDQTDNQTGDDGHCSRQVTEQDQAEHDGSDHYDQRGNIGTNGQCLLRIGAFLAAYEEGRDDRCDDAECGNDQRKCHTSAVDGTNHGYAKSESRDKSANIGLKQVSTHTGYVTHVVADVVCDNSRVSRVILGNAGFHFAHEVGTDVSSLGIDTAADTGKQSNGRSTQGETEQNVVVSGEDVDQAAAEKAEADHTHAHDGTAGEGDAEGLVHTAVDGALCGTHIGFRSGIHSEGTCQDGAASADYKADCSAPVNE